MTTTTAGYDDALGALYRAPHEAFVTERARLTAELKALGDKTGAARLSKLRRPPLSAWAVNQLWWQARKDFDQLFASADDVRAGDLGATAVHRQALTALVGRAKEILEAAGHPATDATLRRVTATLSALAANGSFDPDPAGALTSDRDPPGFDAAGIGVAGTERQTKGGTAPAISGTARATANRQSEPPRQQVDPAERRRLKEARARRQAERQRLEGGLRSARREAEAHARKLERLRSELVTTEERLQKEQARIAEIEARLDELESDD